MKADSFIKVLRKIIREELRNVIKEEIGLLSEAIELKETVKESKTPTKPNVASTTLKSILPSKNTPSKQIVPGGNPLADLINETYQSSDWRSVANMNSSMAPNFGPMGGAEPIVVNSVDQMLASARPAGDVTHVQIDAVPDFSALMGKLKENGSI
jgi:hypothetical protein